MPEASFDRWPSRTNLTSVSPAILAGVLSGIVAFFVFLVLHHVWIKPIWTIFLPGFLIAIGGGALVGWAYAQVAPALPARPWNTVAVLGMIIAILAPGVALSFTHGPLFDLATATIPPGQGARVALRFALELVSTAALVGALLGWWLGRTPVATLSTALAGIAYALGPGHNIPMFGAHPVAFKGLAIVGMLAVITAVVLTEGTLYFERK